MISGSQRRFSSRIWAELTWIFTWILILAVVWLGPVPVMCKTCSNADLFSLQKPCQKENDDFTMLIGQHHDTELCNALHKLWFCTARNVPQCLLNMTDLYQQFTHSPHNCKLSREELVQLQEIHRQSTSQEEYSTVIISTTRRTSPRTGGHTAVGGGEGGDDETQYNVTGSGRTGTGASSALASDHVTCILLSLLTFVKTVLPVL